MTEHVFSTLLVLKSKREGESAYDFYVRIKKCLYAHLIETFPCEDSHGKRLSDIVSEADFIKERVGHDVGMPSGSWSTYETELEQEYVFVLTTVEPRSNERYKAASDHSLCTETIVKMFRIDKVLDVAVQLSVRVWVDYQPFAGFFKTRKLPRTTPVVVERLARMEDVDLRFAPRFVGRREAEKNPALLNGPRLFYPVIRNYKVVSDNDSLKAFEGHLGDPTRPIPLVVFFGDTFRNRKEASVIADCCWTKCRVWILRKGVPGLAELLECIIDGIDVCKNFRWGYCRILFPAGRYRQDDFAQPRYWIPVLRKSHFRKRVKIGLMRFFQMDGRGWIESERELRMAEWELSTENKLHESAENERIQEGLIKQLFSERDDARKSCRTAQAELSKAQNIILSRGELDDEYIRAIDEHDRLVNENACLKSEILSLRSGSCNKSAGTSVPSKVIGEDDAPSSFDTLVWAAEHLFSHLAIVPSAWDNMDRKSRSQRHVGEMWRMLWSLENVLYPMLMDSVCSNVAQKFQDKTGYVYAPKDSPDLPTEMDKKRDVLFEGKLWRIERHIKSGNRDATLLRVYFDVDRDGNRLVVGSLGDHLPTIGTTKIS